MNTTVAVKFSTQASKKAKQVVLSKKRGMSCSFWELSHPCATSPRCSLEASHMLWLTPFLARPPHALCTCRPSLADFDLLTAPTRRRRLSSLRDIGLSTSTPPTAQETHKDGARVHALSLYPLPPPSPHSPSGPVDVLAPTFTSYRNVPMRWRGS